MTEIGYVEARGCVFPVTELAFGDGKLLVSFDMPDSPGGMMPYAVYGPDGGLFTRGAVDVEASAAGVGVTVMISLLGRETRGYRQFMAAAFGIADPRVEAVLGVLWPVCPCSHGACGDRIPVFEWRGGVEPTESDLRVLAEEIASAIDTV